MMRQYQDFLTPHRDTYRVLLLGVTVCSLLTLDATDNLGTSGENSKDETHQSPYPLFLFNIMNDNIST